MATAEEPHHHIRYHRNIWSVTSLDNSSPESANGRCVAEVGGFGARIGSHYDNEAWAPFIVQGTLLLTGPLFFAATIYMMLGRTIRLAGGEDVSLIKPEWYTRVFVFADISTLVIQGLGKLATLPFSPATID